MNSAVMLRRHSLVGTDIVVGWIGAVGGLSDAVGMGVYAYGRRNIPSIPNIPLHCGCGPCWRGLFVWRAAVRVPLSD